MDRLVHVTSEGERWDTLAWRYYGDVSEVERIITANPHMPITPVLPGGVRIFIPVVRAAELNTTSIFRPGAPGRVRNEHERPGRSPCAPGTDHI